MSRKLHLLVVEFDYHAEVLSVLLPMLQERFEITLFTTEKIASKLYLPCTASISIVVKGRREKVTRFLQRTCQLWSKVDVVYLNTLEKNFRVFSSFSFKHPVILRVHNMNATFRHWRSIDFSNIPLAKIVWHIIYNSAAWHYKAKVLAAVDCIMLPSDGVKKFAEEGGWLLHKDKIAPFCLPFARPLPVNGQMCGTEPVVIVVTGTVDPDRKDYDELLKALELVKKGLDKAIVLHFLGPPRGERGREVIQRFKALVDHNFDFRYSLEYVPQADVEQAMLSACFLVAPLLARTRFKIHEEFYGRTKISGVENDIIRFRMPALLPQGYNVADALATGCEFYSGPEDLARIITAWVSKSEYIEKKARLAELDDGEWALQQFELLCRQLINNKSARGETETS